MKNDNFDEDDTFFKTTSLERRKAINKQKKL